MSFKTKIIIAILIAAVTIAVGFYFIYQKYYFSSLIENNSQLQTEKPAAAGGEPRPAGREITKPELKKPLAPIPPAPTVLTGYKLYKNSEFGFEIQYPASWVVTEEINENVRGEMVKEFYFKKPASDLRFAILPRDGLSYGLPSGGISEDVNISGFLGVQTKYITADGRRLLLVHPQVNIFNWDPGIGRLDIMSGVLDPVGDFKIFNQMLNSFKFLNI